jgi:hypothetical protein
MKEMGGEYTKASEDSPSTWLSTDRELALTFSTEPARAKACDNTNLRISDQGYGIPKELYQQIVQPRKKRDVRESQLAAGLTASQIHTARAIQQLFHRECRRTNRAENPTLLVRKLLSKKTLQARWLTENELEVWSCIQLSFDRIEFRSTEKCYRFIPIKARFRENQLKIDSFLDPVLRIISSSSQEADCLHYRYHLVEKKQGVWLRVDTKTGKIFSVPKASIYQVYETTPNKSGGLLDIKPLIFHEMILTNSTEIFPHVDELMRFQNWKTKISQEKATKANNLGALQYGIKGIIEGYLEEIWEYIKARWYLIACSYATFLLLRDVVGPIAWAYLIGPIMQGVGHLKPRNGWQKLKYNFWKREPERRNRRRDPSRNTHFEELIEEMRQLQPIVNSQGNIPRTNFYEPRQITWRNGEENVTFHGEMMDEQMRSRSNTGPFNKRRRPSVRIEEIE